MTMKILKINSNKFKKNSTSGVYCFNNKKTFSYTDGDITENKIYKILSKINYDTDIEKQLEKYIFDWATEYHFSPFRANLLRHIPISSTDSILELGSGCGALTRSLAAKGAHVTAVEGSLIRAKCTALRCKDLSNVKVFCSDFQNMEFDTKFDIVTLIGVLEYAPVFIEDNNPLETCISLAKNFLKKNGRLIIAIENRLGLKYFLGFSEDHYGKPYVGIQDQYPLKGPKTMGKDELERLIFKGGFTNIEFQYPFPDYKIPSLILKEKALDINKLNKSDLITRYQSRDYFRPFKPTIDETKIWPILEKNTLINQFSNSFLVMASNDKAHDIENNVAILYTNDRKRKYNTKTEFILCKSRIMVKKSLLETAQVSKSKIITFLSQTNEYIEGECLQTALKHALDQQNLDRLISLLDRWLVLLIEKGLQNKTKQIFESPIKPDFIDCFPSNIIIKNNNLYYIDREWMYYKSYSLALLLLRGLYQFQTSLSLGDFVYDKESRFGRIMHIWFKKIGFHMDNSIIKDFIESENEICDEVYGKDKWQPIRSMKNVKTFDIFLITLKRKVKNMINAL
jgi:2-polyprenyl-3-methyl-5-hydroxy-6-metoxy-1,4-benzoquinol methylase